MIQVRANPIKPHEIPLYLIQQKKMWDVEEYYRIASQDPNWLSWLIEDDELGLTVGAFIVCDDALHFGVRLQTVIVDKPYRTTERVAEATWMGRNAALMVAKMLGRKWGFCASQHAEKYMKYGECGPTAEIVESVIREEA
jgi:hypothetical protein